MCGNGVRRKIGTGVYTTRVRKKLIIGGVLALLVLAFVFWLTRERSTEPIQFPTATSELTISQLQDFANQAKQLNEKRDYSLVISSTHYQKDIGVYNGKIVQLAFKCWGDLCPDNGAYFITYKDVLKEDCARLGGYIVEGYSGWGSMTYGGCSPIK